MGFPMRKLILLLLCSLLAACGGGASVSPVTPIAPASVFPDMRNIFSKVCGNDTVIQTVHSVDLNNDGRPDLILDAWCDLNGQKLSNWPIGSTYNGPIPNTVIALLQKADGTFEIGNKQVFGTDILALEGDWGTPAIGDFNNDGRPDIAFSTSKEDGRAPVTFSDGTNNFSSHVQVLLSSSTIYSLHTLGEAGPSIRLNVVKDNQNRDLLVFGDNAYQYTNRWVSYSYSSITNGLALFSYNNSNYLVNQIYGNNQLGVNLLKQINNAWTSIDTFLLPNMRQVDTYAAQYGVNGYTKQYLITINDVDWLTPSIYSGCVISNSNNEKTIAVVFEGIKLNQRYTGQLLEFGDPNLGPYIGQLMLINIQNDRITTVTTPSNMSVDKYFGQICADVNNDKSQDIIITRWNDGVGVTPYIFMNHSGTFTPVSSNNIPVSPDYYRGNSSYVTDLYNDGNVVLIYYPLLGVKSTYTGEIKLQLYKNNGSWN